MLEYLSLGVRKAFMPRRMGSRALMHGVATIAGIFGAWRFGGGFPALSFLVWYVAFFFLAHLAAIPLLTGWYMARDRAERWIRGIIEEELIHFDLKTYQRQLSRVFPGMKKPPDEH